MENHVEAIWADFDAPCGPDEIPFGIPVGVLEAIFDGAAKPSRRVMSRAARSLARRIRGVNSPFFDEALSVTADEAGNGLIGLVDLRLRCVQIRVGLWRVQPACIPPRVAEDSREARVPQPRQPPQADRV
jgi:hypothetical protein